MSNKPRLCVNTLGQLVFIEPAHLPLANASTMTSTGTCSGVHSSNQRVLAPCHAASPLPVVILFFTTFLAACYLKIFVRNTSQANSQWYGTYVSHPHSSYLVVFLSPYNPFENKVLRTLAIQVTKSILESFTTVCVAALSRASQAGIACVVLSVFKIMMYCSMSRHDPCLATTQGH